MKKILLFLTLSFIYLISSTPIVNAQTDTFYKAEYIDNIYMVKYDKKTGVKHYEQARVFRRTSDGRIAYCLQPFIYFDESNNTYENVESLPNMSDELKEKLIDIIGMGYGYPSNGYNLKWYAVTQLMIWQAVEPDSEFYFTDRLNGNKITDYDDEIASVNKLINTSYEVPSFHNKTFYGITGKSITIEDTNNVLYHFSNPEGVIKDGNKLTITKNESGCYDIEFYKNYSYGSPILFYYNPNNQQLATTGNPYNKYSNVRFCFNELKLNIKKIDKDTGNTTSKGEASLKDAIFTLYNENMEKITDISLDDNMEASISSNDYDLNYGTYYLKETTPGTGYLPNDKVYEINFTGENPTIELTIENKVIEKEVTIKKLYGDGLLMQTEPNITFEIYDINDTLISTITTDTNGTAKVTLPYGHYKIIQTNTTEGYTKIEPFEIFISDQNKDYYYTINDYEIPKEEVPEEEISIEVPNTGTTYNDNYNLISLILPIYFLVKKKFS